MFLFLFQELKEGCYWRTDYYVDHAIVNNDAGSVLLMTNFRLLVVSRNFGRWKVSCQCQFDFFLSQGMIGRTKRAFEPPFFIKRRPFSMSD